MEYYTYKEVAEKFNVSMPTVTNWVKKGLFMPGINLGRTKTLTKESVGKKLKDENFIKAVQISQKGSAKATIKETVANEDLEHLKDEIVRRVTQDIKLMLEGFKYDFEQKFSVLINELNKIKSTEQHSKTKKNTKQKGNRELKSELKQRTSPKTSE